MSAAVCGLGSDLAGLVRRHHGPTGGELRPVWADPWAAGSVGGCVSCPLSRRHIPRKSNGVRGVRGVSCTTPMVSYTCS
ncbi:hypothetical protein F3K20_14375 [Streptomyces scabiei]|nr:hypothetical protein [Streptomyces sp. LBUM 1484]MBP5867271.1 hypothetical protein [Streptomyces sp. LBUM 1485]MBP5875631.1 hypothetical protein [Streptomyces sp. LBUM 1477]MBP5883447.1 hypothetical protein [Streptomyces sp. LBUM 1487]MBP5893727.1 hypothetical protein [Streptomyces sp. LBUM 1481]MBP5899473.1 hypothetical protein [Streptomyces sp. LBUM 1488]MBP5916940.1 hypothetical protein [Streptomyces sp. LBUM 1486]MBP5923974.1 hypothetical protein [Streptomyces sp. LBUM 1483]MBP593155